MRGKPSIFRTRDIYCTLIVWYNVFVLSLSLAIFIYIDVNKYVSMYIPRVE